MTDWHLVNYGQFAQRGAALTVVEASAVLPEGRISPEDLGLWNDEQIASHARTVEFIHSQGQKAGVQLAHAGRKASTAAMFLGNEPVGPAANGWPDDVVGPSTVPMEGNWVPHEASHAYIRAAIDAFAAAAKRAVRAGYDVIEIHGAHGYLISSFLSPFANKRVDEYGGSFGNRARLALEVARAVRSSIPEGMPLFFRVSGTDWASGGWSLDETVQLARLLAEAGVDLLDVSSGGNTLDAKIPVGPGYQLPLSQAVKEANVGILVSGVGIIENGRMAEQALQEKKADVIFIARGLLADSGFVLQAAQDLQVRVKWPQQYERARSWRHTGAKE